MRVLHVIPTLGSGGAEKMLVDIIREMQEQNIYCEVVVLTKKDNFFGVEMERLNIPLYYSDSPKVYSLKNIQFLRQIIKAKEYDCIHTHLFAAQFFTPIAKILTKNTSILVTTEHSTHNKRRDKKVFYTLDKWMYKQYQGIIAITEGTKENLTKYLPDTECKTKVITNGIDINIYENASAIKKEDIDNSIKENDKIILMVAAMREQKDHETLIRASKLLPADYRVVFVGDGERSNEVKKYAKNFGSSSIVFLGRRSDIPNIMKASDVFVLSSKWEGFGLVIVEAAATGLPTVASNVEGLREVTLSVGGQVFTSFDEYDLAEKISVAVNVKNKEIDVSKYTIQKTVEEYLKLYNEQNKKWKS
ncbi:glycosyltransferase [Bacillus ndiopicus]|uniref:glycosyltransferase n=1 Tax=Bacillus ndiopicus TaxID=1347368 RepID=UPI0006936128|nr:glycosyltransferase [Bacillus ndiopicus]